MTQDAATYEEPARSYATVWVFAAVLAVGFAIDASLGGAVAHLLGWLIAFVLVVGVNVLFVYAVRSEKSLRLTAGELRVGDEAVARADVVAVASGVDDAELPVLGWPNGPPRGMKAITVRLADGRDIVVPTRFADRLTAALGVGAVHGPAHEGPHGQGVRAAARTDLPLLEEIDTRAEAVFRAAGLTLPDLPMRPADIDAAVAIFVAGRPPVGFVLVHEVDGLAHVQEIAVIPKWMRQGIGGRLLERACEWAAQHDYPAVTLTTYADVPWNAPFYRAHGFAEVTDLTPGLAARRAEEAELGLDAVGRRIAMRRELS